MFYTWKWYYERFAFNSCIRCWSRCTQIHVCLHQQKYFVQVKMDTDIFINNVKFKLATLILFEPYL